MRWDGRLLLDFTIDLNFKKLRLGIVGSQAFLALPRHGNLATSQTDEVSFAFWAFSCCVQEKVAHAWVAQKILNNMLCARGFVWLNLNSVDDNLLNCRLHAAHRNTPKAAETPKWSALSQGWPLPKTMALKPPSQMGPGNPARLSSTIL